MYFVGKDKKKLEKNRAYANSRLKNYCKQKGIGLIYNEKKRNQHGIKKLHLNRKGNNLFGKNLQNFIKDNGNLSPERNLF